MNLSNDLLKEFVKSTHDEVEKKEGTTCYGTARFDDGDYVLLDGATTPTPATFMVNAVSGDRVLCSIKNHKLIVTANVTNPMMTLGLLKANTGIIVGGYLTTNENRLTYDDQAHNGLTFSAGGLGAYGGSGKYWYVKNTGELYASSADISGRITAKEGFIGTSDKGFIIDESSIYSGTKSGTADGNLTISNADFKRSINGTQREGLRFALGSKFGVTSSGKIYASDVDISGKITSSSGSLGNFTLGTAIYSGNKNELTSPNAGVYLGTNGISLGAGSTFKVTSAGELTATSGTIGPWSVTTTALYKTNSTFGDEHSLYFGDLGLSLTDKFKVTNAGALTATGATLTGSITAESGYLGTAANGFTIDQYGIFSGTKTGTNAGNITLANGSFSRVIGGSSSPITDLRFAIGANFGVTDSGVLYAAGAHISGEVEADSGSIGPWTISRGGLYKLGDDAPSVSTDHVSYKMGTARANNKVLLVMPYVSGPHEYTATYLVEANVGERVLVKIEGDYAGTTGAGLTFTVVLNETRMKTLGYKQIGGAYLGDNGFSISDNFFIDPIGETTIRGSSLNIDSICWYNSDDTQYLDNGTAYLRFRLYDADEKTAGVSGSIDAYGGIMRIYQDRQEGDEYASFDATPNSLGNLGIYSDVTTFHGGIYQLAGTGASSASLKVDLENLNVRSQFNIGKDVVIRQDNIDLFEETQWSGSSTSITSGSWQHPVSSDSHWEIRLMEGFTYLVLFGADFDANATGNRMVQFTSTSEGGVGNRYTPSCAAASGAHTRLVGSVTAHPTSSTSHGYQTYGLYVYQNSGSNLNVLPWYRIIRLPNG